jgi:hypothetical protein
VAVAGAIDHRAAEALREVGGDLIKAVKHRPPPLVARGRGVLSRGDHVGEQHGAQGAMGLGGCGMAAGEELLDLGGDPVGIGGPGRVGCAVNLEVPRGKSDSDERARLETAFNSGVAILNEFDSVTDALIKRGFEVYSPRRRLGYRFSKRRWDRVVDAAQRNQCDSPAD